MTDQELNEIEARVNVVPASIRDDLLDIIKCWNLFSDKGKYALLFLIDAHKDISALLAEVRMLSESNLERALELARLRLTIDDMTKEVRQLKAERDVLADCLIEICDASICPASLDDGCPKGKSECDLNTSDKSCWIEWGRKEVEKGEEK